MVYFSFQNREILVLLTFCLGSIYNVYVTFEVLEREIRNIVSYAIESCFDKD